MDPLEFVSDRSIRRALGFAGLGIGLVMLSLSYDLPLALRSGADLAALVAVTLLVMAWLTPRRDLRHSEPLMMLNELLPGAADGMARADVQRRLKEVLRRRLLWHAERIGLLAVVLWGAMLLVAALR
jgi:hypothetical protein